eukprot:TRINITY_DN2435_c1_g1_i1.p1 TRINITY_DN2435_c1_g1~~TRINITY_DN2435_c1_g1_i1.p1  ORF type:complete len:378 (+),score=92.75 TRINITY_DN2435_c1_g1_i1:199-1332(+)
MRRSERSWRDRSNVDKEMNKNGDGGDTQNIPMVLESTDPSGQKRYRLEGWKGNKDEKPGFKSRPIYFTEPFNIYLIWRVLLLEYIGTTLFVFFACGSVVSASSFGLSSAATALLAALIQGLAIATFVYAISHTTGGHINPAVTLCLMTSGHVGLIRGCCYIVMQLAGGVTGAALVLAVVPFPYDRSVYLGVTLLTHGTSPFQGFIFEFILTFSLLFTIYGTAINVESSASGSHVLAPLPIGFAVFIGVATAYNFTGGSLNPARTFGPALINNTWTHNYIYWFGPFAASVIVGMLERHVLLVVVDKDQKQEKVPGNGNMCTTPAVEELDEVDDSGEESGEGEEEHTDQDNSDHTNNNNGNHSHNEDRDRAMEEGRADS